MHHLHVVLKEISASKSFLALRTFALHSVLALSERRDLISYEANVHLVERTRLPHADLEPVHDWYHFLVYPV